LKPVRYKGFGLRRSAPDDRERSKRLPKWHRDGARSTHCLISRSNVSALGAASASK
jgi:hypothetical protein